MASLITVTPSFSRGRNLSAKRSLSKRGSRRTKSCRSETRAQAPALASSALGRGLAQRHTRKGPGFSRRADPHRTDGDAATRREGHRAPGGHMETGEQSHSRAPRPGPCVRAVLGVSHARLRAKPDSESPDPGAPAAHRPGCSPEPSHPLGLHRHTGHRPQAQAATQSAAGAERGRPGSGAPRSRPGCRGVPASAGPRARPRQVLPRRRLPPSPRADSLSLRPAVSAVPGPSSRRPRRTGRASPAAVSPLVARATRRRRGPARAKRPPARSGLRAAGFSGAASRWAGGKSLTSLVLGTGRKGRNLDGGYLGTAVRVGPSGVKEGGEYQLVVLRPDCTREAPGRFKNADALKKKKKKIQS